MKHLVGWLLAIILGAGFFFFFFILASHDYRWEAIAPYRDNLLKGWGVTVGISAAALVLSTFLGALLTAGQLSAVAPARWLSRIYLELVRGTPLLVQLLIGFYILAPYFGITNRYWVGIVLLAAFAGAYLSEIFRGGIESVPRSQLNAARAVGFSGSQAYRFVIIPQAVRRILPATAGQFANLVKDSSLLYSISVLEFYAQAKQATATTYAHFEAYLPLAVGYLILTLPISIWTRRLEAKTEFVS